jgi:hypothetical protein
MTTEKMEEPTHMKMEQAWMVKTLWLMMVMQHIGQGRVY